jgi:hypothetical protein
MKILKWYLVSLCLQIFRRLLRCFCCVTPSAQLFTSYNVAISRYFAPLCWVQYLYHSYVGEITWCEIFWWLYWSLSLLLGHFFCLFRRAQPPFCGSDYYLHILGVLGIDCFCTCLSFPTGQSLYYSKCNNTYWDRPFLVLHKTKRCLNHITLGCSLSGPTLWKPNGLILSPIVSFFGGLLRWTKVCFNSSKCSFKYHASMSPLMCRSKGMHLVINSFYHISISFIMNSFFYSTMYSSWIVTSYSCPLFTMLVWSYHWQSKYPFVLVPLWEWAYNNPQHTSKYYCSYCFGEWSTCWKGNFPLFPLSHSTTNGYSYH